MKKEPGKELPDGVLAGGQCETAGCELEHCVSSVSAGADKLQNVAAEVYEIYAKQ